MWAGRASQPALAVVRSAEASTPESQRGGQEPWLRSILEAAARARSADTPEAWAVVASAADLVSEMARALELVAEAARHAAARRAAAGETARLAHEAGEVAGVATREAEAATARARALEAAVALARRVNSPESWGEVRKLAMNSGVGNPPSVHPHVAPDVY